MRPLAPCSPRLRANTDQTAGADWFTDSGRLSRSLHDAHSSDTTATTIHGTSASSSQLAGLEFGFGLGRPVAGVLQDGCGRA